MAQSRASVSLVQAHRRSLAPPITMECMGVKTPCGEAEPGAFFGAAGAHMHDRGALAVRETQFASAFSFRGRWGVVSWLCVSTFALHSFALIP